MKKFLSLFIITLLCASSVMAQDHCTLVADTVTIPPLRKYCVYIKDYSDAMKQHVASGMKFAIKYSSADESVVKPYGNMIESVDPGECDVTMRIAGVAEGTLDSFDEDQLLDEVTFHVVVEDDLLMQMPPFQPTWGVSRAQNLKWFTEEKGLECITEKYADMHANIDGLDLSDTEVIDNGNYEAPLTYLYFDEDDKLCEAAILVANAERLSVPHISSMCKWLEASGFELNPDSYTVGGTWEMYNPAYYTVATYSFTRVQSCIYYALCFYPEDRSAGIEEVNSEQATVDGEQLYNLAGQRVTESSKGLIISRGKKILKLTDK